MTVRFRDLKKEEFRRLQLKLADILFFVDDICKKYNLIYYATYGTCLGAVRHHGFIPWDDDLDIAMPRPDFEKLYNVLNNEEKNDKYVALRTTKEQCIGFHIMHIRDITTTMIYKHSVDYDIPHGLKIDVGPIDGCPSDKFHQLVQNFWARLFSLFGAQRIPNSRSKTTKLCAQFLLSIIRSKSLRGSIMEYAQKQLSKYPITPSGLVVKLSGCPEPYKLYGTPAKLMFEGRLISVPAQYGAHLKKNYGDYMQFPPKSERYPVTEVTFLDLDTPYTVYRGIEFAKRQK